MPEPITAGRKDIIFRAALDPSDPSTLENWCGANSISFSVSNEIVSNKVGDCHDWSKAIRTVKNYGGQDGKATISASYAKSAATKLAEWAFSQHQLPCEIEFAGATTGELHLIKGTALLVNYQIEGIGNLDGNVVTNPIELEFTNDLEMIIAS